MSDSEQLIGSDDEIWAFLIDALYDGPVEVLFEKANGTMRTMLCTLRKDLIEYEFKETDEPEAVDHKSADVVTVWDIESKGWRKLTKSRIDTVNVIGEDDTNGEG